MKLRKMIALVVAFIALALMATACNKTDNKTESLPNTNATSAPGKNSSSTPSAASSPGTTSSGPNSTAMPTEVTKAFYDAAKNKDVQGMKSVLSKKTLDALDKAAKTQNKTVDEMLKTSNDAEPPPATLETRNETINGDKATVEVSNGKGGWQPFNFIKEDGQWKLDIPGAD